MFSRIWRRVPQCGPLFNGEFIDARVLFLHLNRVVPSIMLVTDIDASKAFAFVRDNMGASVISTRQFNRFNHEEGSSQFICTVFVLGNRRIIYLGMNYVEILHAPGDFDWAGRTAVAFAEFRVVMESAPPAPMGFALARMN